ncbi:MAG: Ig-like domain-containing protein [Nanoarchaeota archaeon]
MPGLLSSRNLLALAIIFFLISLINVFVALQITNSQLITGKAYIGEAQVCIKRFPTLTINSSFDLTEGVPFYTEANFTNPNNATISFSDDTDLFIINSTTGEISFTPSVMWVGIRNVIITLSETNTLCLDQVISAFVSFNIYGLSSLQIWDETDSKGGNKTRHAIDKVLFFANYSKSNGSIIMDGDAKCYFRVNVTSGYTDFINMTFNNTYGVYITNYTTNANGNFTWQVFCNSTNLLFPSRNATDILTITNNPPIKIADYPNQSWNANTVLFGESLYDYFIDTDGDRISFTHPTVSSINITVDNLTGVVKFVPATNFYGNRTVIFTASDGYGGEARTEPVYLSVLFVQPQISSAGSSTSSGGGGGGGGVSLGDVCSENWECGPYGPCLPTALRVRACIDLALCDTSYQRPNDSISCNYRPTCNDSIRNQAELGVDCGGPCQACPTCEDKIQNQGELGVDCGGPCSACASCYDNIQNEGELGLDCGGPCAPCASCSDGIQNQGELGVDCGGQCKTVCITLEKPDPFANIRLFGLIMFLLLLLLLLSTLGYKYVWPRLAPLLAKKRIKDRITLSEVIAQTLQELATIKKRTSNVPPKEIVDDVSDLIKTFFYHYFDMETPFSFNLMGLMTEQHPQPPKLQKALLAYSKHMMEIQYEAEVKQEDAFTSLKDSEILVNECAKAALPIIISQNIMVIKELVSKAKTLLEEKNVQSANRAMGRVKKLFDVLPLEEQKNIEGLINSVNEKVKLTYGKNK